MFSLRLRAASWPPGLVTRPLVPVRVFAALSAAVPGELSPKRSRLPLAKVTLLVASCSGETFCSVTSLPLARCVTTTFEPETVTRMSAAAMADWSKFRTSTVGENAIAWPSDSALNWYVAIVGSYGGARPDDQSGTQPARRR